MTGKDLKKLLKKLGFVKIRQKGSHEIYMSPTGHTISLPKKKKSSEIMSPHYEKQIYAAAQNPSNFDLGHALVLMNVANARSECIASILKSHVHYYKDLERQGLIKISRIDGPHLSHNAEPGEQLMVYTVCSSITEKGMRFNKGDVMKEFRKGVAPALKRMRLSKSPSKNPTPVPKHVKDKQLWLKQRAKVKNRVAVWPSAYASGQVVQEYKRAGGRFYNPGKLTEAEILDLELTALENPMTGLDKWFAEEWVDIGRSIYLSGPKAGQLKPGGWQPCGRKDSDKGKYPKCRPIAEVKAMSPKERLYAVKKKRKAEKKAPNKQGRKPIMVKTYKGGKRKHHENPKRKELYIKPNKASVKVAKQALERRKKLPKSKRGGLSAQEAHDQGIGSGVLRARDIAAGKRINAYQVKAFFDRHRHNFVKAKADGKKWEESKAWQAWDLWGGEPLRKQVEKAVKEDKKKRKKEKREKNPVAKKKSVKNLKHKVRQLDREAEGVAKGAAIGTAVGGLAGAALAPPLAPVGAGVGAYTGAVLGKRAGKRKHDKELDAKRKKGKGGRKDNPRPFEDRPHEWGEVLIQRRGKKLTRKQIRDYYRRNQDKIWPFLEGQTVMVIMATKKNHFVRMRHGPSGKFIKLTKLKGINDPKSYEYWINRRIVEFHPTLTTKSTPILWLDLDIHTTKGEKVRKKLLTKMRREAPKIKQVFKEMGVRNVRVYTSGTEGGYHFEGNLPKPMAIDPLRRRFTKALAQAFEDDPTMTTGIAKSGQIRLDTTTLHKLGSLRAPHSMTTSGTTKKPVDL